MEIVREFTKQLESRLQEKLNFIQVVIGPRQVGKTTGIRQIVKKWPHAAHMVSADESVGPSRDWIDLQWRKARAMGDNVLLVIDEVQKIPGWSSSVKRLFDEDREARRMKIVLLGSASLAVQKGLGESLAGRYELIHADHWSLRECHEAFGWGLDAFLKFGGYPAAAELTGDIRRWQAFMRDSIVEPVLIKDLLALSAVNKPALFRQTFEIALSYPGQEVSLQKMLGQLQESGNVTTIKHYLTLFEGAFLLKALQKYSGSTIRSRGSSPKILPLNTALIHAFHDPLEVDRNPEWYGRVFECAIGSALNAVSGNLFYWRDGGDEVDFVLEQGQMLYAIEVKSGRTRSNNGLQAFLRRYPHAIPVTVHREQGERFLMTGDILSCLPHA